MGCLRSGYKEKIGKKADEFEFKLIISGYIKKLPFLLSISSHIS